MSYGLGFCLAEPQHEIKLEIGKWRLRHEFFVPQFNLGEFFLLFITFLNFYDYL
jgi:hypothetical protein